ncbi:uncharacterized protein [Asterias amurensis]|uniref:uncharacterized protein n=1 Tax=Asterias amurensis TaxID=7602 RepID=UPI003AB5A784
MTETMNQLCVPILLAVLLMPCLVQCIPTFTRKGERYSPCLIDGDCLSVQHCQWLPSAREPNGWCVFDLSEVRSRGRKEYQRNKRLRRTTYSEDSLVGDATSQHNEMQPRVRGVNDPHEMKGVDYANNYKDYGGVQQRFLPRRPTEHQPMLGGADGLQHSDGFLPRRPTENQPMLDGAVGLQHSDMPRRPTENQPMLDGADGLQHSDGFLPRRPTENQPMLDGAVGLQHSDMPRRPTENQPMLDQLVEDGNQPQNSNSEFVISEDNTRDTYELNNAMDINRIHIPTQKSLGLYLNGGGPDRTDSRNQAHGYDEHQNKGNGMEDDVGFADDIVHDPIELAAAAEAAAIRDGDDLPDDFDHTNGLGWRGGDE